MRLAGDVKSGTGKATAKMDIHPVMLFAMATDRQRSAVL